MFDTADPDAPRQPASLPSFDTSAFRDRPLDRSTWREVAAMVPDVGRLLRALIADPRVRRRDKAIAATALVYVASPLDPLPDVVPGTGIGLDDVVALAWGVRRLVASAGYEVVREHWGGTDAGFVLLMLFTGVDA